MKITIKKLFTIGFIAFIFIAINSCSDNPDLNTKQQELSIQKAEFSYLNLKYSEEMYPFFSQSNMLNSFNNFNVKKTVSHTNRSMAKEAFERLINDLNDYYNLNLDLSNTVGIVSYSNVSNTEELNNFTNIVVIKRNLDNLLEFLEYSNTNDILTQLEHNQKTYSFIPFNYLGYLGHKLNKDNVSISSIFKATQSLNNTTQNPNLTPSNIELTYINEFPIIPYSKDGGHFCKKSECDSTSRGFCGIVVGSGNEDPICNPSGYVEDNECADDDESLEPAKSLAGTNYKDKMYLIRDTFLANSEIGSKYINYYYKLSYIFKVVGIYDSHPEEVNEIMNFIRSKSVLFVTSNQNTIMITQSEYSFLIDKINDFKTYTDNEEYHFIMDDLADDLLLLKLKTKSQILSLL